jgi:mono/diheme cytochrome c family protein
MSEGSHEAFQQIVLEGLLNANGMAAFNDVLNAEDTDRIHAYIKVRAEEDRLVAAGEKDEAQLTWLN